MIIALATIAAEAREPTDSPNAFGDARVALLVAHVRDSAYEAADKALAAGADVNAVAPDGQSPLLYVMRTTLDQGKIEYLLKKGANPNYVDADSRVSVMYFAAGGNRTDILELLLRYKGDANLEGPDGTTLLGVAVEQQRERNIDLLLRHGADVNATDGINRTAAHHAATLGRFDLVLRLLDAGLTEDLPGLSRLVQLRRVPPASEMQRSKERLLSVLAATAFASSPVATLAAAPYHCVSTRTSLSRDRIVDMPLEELRYGAYARRNNPTTGTTSYCGIMPVPSTAYLRYRYEGRAIERTFDLSSLTPSRVERSSGGRIAHGRVLRGRSRSRSAAGDGDPRQ